MRIQISLRFSILVAFGFTAAVQGVSFSSMLTIDGPPRRYIQSDLSDSNFVLLGRWGAGPCYASDANEEIVCLGNGAYLDIVDFSDPSEPDFRGRFLTPSTILGVRLENDLAFVADHKGGLRIIDVSEPQNPREVGYCVEIVDCDDIVIQNQLAYVADFGTGVAIVDISDPQDPVVIGRLESVQYATGLFVEGSFAYLADEYFGFHVADVSDPANPELIGVLDGVNATYKVSLSGTQALVANSVNGFSIIDVSDPASPSNIGSYDPGFVLDVVPRFDYAFVACHYYGMKVVDYINSDEMNEIASIRMEGHPDDITLHGTYLYSANQDGGLASVDISDLENPFLEGVYFTADETFDVQVVDDMAFVAGGQAGLLIIDFHSPMNPRHMGTYDNPFTVSSVTIRGDFAYITDHTGLRIIDVHDPVFPEETGYCSTPGFSEDVALFGENACVADGHKGIRVVDISIPEMPVEIGSYEFGGFSDVSGLCVAAGYTYVAAGDSGFRVLDITDKECPVEIGALTGDGDTYVYDVDIAGDMACISGYNWTEQSSGTLWIVDISDPATPRLLGEYSYFGRGRGIKTYGNIVIVAAEYGGIVAVDVSDPYNPFQVGLYQTGGEAYSIDIENNAVYAADGTDGIYMLDYAGSVGTGVSNRHPAEIAVRSYPNPSSGRMNITLWLPEAYEINVSIHNLTGRRIKNLFHGKANSGNSVFPWHGRDDHGITAANGVYVIRIDAGKFEKRERVILLR